MKKLYFIAVLLMVVSLKPAAAQGTNLETEAKEITVYHSGATVLRVSEKDFAVGKHELSIRGISAKTVLSSLTIKNAGVAVLNKQLLRRIGEEEMNGLQDEKSLLTAQIGLLQNKYEDTSFVKNAQELNEMLQMYADKMLTMKARLRVVEDKIAKDAALQSNNLTNPDAAVLELTILVSEKVTKRFELEYVVGGIGWAPAYEMAVKDLEKDKIQVKYLAGIMSQTGEDWNNVQLKLSSSFPLEAAKQLPKPSRSWTLSRSNSNERPAAAKLQEQQAYNKKFIADLKGVEYQTIRTPASLDIRTLPGVHTIKSNSTLFTFPILEEAFPAQYYYYAYPSLDPEAYLVAEISGWSQFGFVDGVAFLSYNGNNVGKTEIKFSEAFGKLVVPISVDNNILVQRSEIQDQKYFKNKSLSKTNLSTLAYKFEVKNNHPYAVALKLLDQLPVAQINTAKVELEETSEGKITKGGSEIAWKMTLEPTQSVDKTLVYTIESQGSFSFSSGRKSKALYRSQSSPRYF